MKNGNRLARRRQHSFYLFPTSSMRKGSRFLLAGRDSDAEAGIRLLAGRDVSSLFLRQDQVTNLEQLGESVWCTFGKFVGNIAGESAKNKIGRVHGQ